MPNVLGRYEIIEELGRGAMGVVYKARDPVLDRIVAIKTMPADAIEDDELRLRLEREAAAAARLRHPNIITVHDYGEEGGVPFIAMEFLEGIDLKQILRNRITLYPLEKLSVLRQVAMGLGHAHKAGIVHRDVKPANIRILRDGTVKLMDFGIARIASSQLTRVGTVLGSVDYMSPEQVEGKQVDHRCDVFCFGVVAYEVLTYRVPFKAENMPATMRNILEAKVPPIEPEALAPLPGIEEVIHRCLRREPAERFENFLEVLRQLDAIQGGLKSDRGEVALPVADGEGGDSEQETVMISPGEPAEPGGGDWQGGDSTVSGVQLWADRDRFQRISSVIEKGEKRKPRPVSFPGRQSPKPAPARDAMTSRGEPSRATRSSRLRAGIVVALLLVFVGGVGLFFWSRGPATDSSVSQFVERQLLASAAKADAGDLRGALTDLERILEVRPDHSEATSRIEELKARVDRSFAEALSTAQDQLASGDFQAAISSLEGALDFRPGDAGARSLLDDARARARTAETQEDERYRFEGLLREGRAHLEAGRLPQAVASFQAASALTPSSSEASSLLTEARRRDSQKRDAERAYQSGVAALGRGELERAVADLERATALDPSHRQAKERLAEARREQTRPRFGVLTINALPFGEAFLNGKSLGTTPIRLEEVPAGRHEVRIVKGGYLEFSRTVTVSEGETTNVVAQLERSPRP